MLQMVRRTGSVSSVLLSLLLSCTTPPPDNPGPSHPTSPGTPPSSASPEPASAPGKPIRFEVDLQEHVEAWRQVGFFPFGSSDEHLGISACVDCERIGPRIITVDEDGGLWIADNYKHRIAHFGPDGAYLGNVRFPGARNVRDLEVLRGDLVALLDYGTLVLFNGRGDVEDRGSIRQGIQKLYLYDLYVAGDRLFAYSFGTDAGRGPKGAVEVVDIDAGSVRSVPGVPVSDSSDVWVDLLGHGRKRWYELRIARADGTSVTRRFQFTSASEGQGKHLLVDVELQGVIRGRLLVSANPLAPPWSDPVNQGTWLLLVRSSGGVAEDGRVSLPEAGTQTIIVGADTRIYRMLYRPGGILVERR
jgi:hypothetical protein